MENDTFRIEYKNTFVARMRKGRIGKPGPWKGKKTPQSMKDKQSKTMKVRTKGQGNSQYGTCWICHIVLKMNRKIKRAELNDWLQEGWIKGRKLSYKSYKKNSGD